PSGSTWKRKRLASCVRRDRTRKTPDARRITPMSDPIDDVLRPLGARFAAAGHELYLVGGGVRDRLMGQPIHDVDLATSARPDESRRLLAETGADAVWAVGERFSTIGAMFGGDQVEVTTFRGAEPGRFEASIEADLS